MLAELDTTDRLLGQSGPRRHLFGRQTTRFAERTETFANAPRRFLGLAGKVSGKPRIGEDTHVERRDVGILAACAGASRDVNVPVFLNDETRPIERERIAAHKVCHGDSGRITIAEGHADLLLPWVVLHAVKAQVRTFVPPIMGHGAILRYLPTVMTRPILAL